MWRIPSSAAGAAPLRFDNVHLEGVPVLRSEAEAAEAAAAAGSSSSDDESEDSSVDWRRRKTQTSGVVYTSALPTEINNPTLVSASIPALKLFLPMELVGKEEDRSSESLSGSGGEEGRVPRFLPADVERQLLDSFSGCTVPDGADPVAHCYCGHQFGNFAGQLGDGRAISLGLVEAPQLQDDGAAGPPRPARKGDLHWLATGGSWEEISTAPEDVLGRWELQMKGAGQTVYSRGSDGRAVLRSSIREFLASEFMQALGIPTTRAATLIVSGAGQDKPVTTVLRDKFYDGNAAHEPCAVVLRLARCFIRLGSFQTAVSNDPSTRRSGPSAGDPTPVRALIESVCRLYYPDIFSSLPADLPRPDVPAFLARRLFPEVCRRTARLVAMWQCTGFCHGVLNTDNVSVLGVTIDYGPYGFMEYFDQNHICNSSDNQGRYSYKNQPDMCRFDLDLFGTAIFEATGVPKDEVDALISEHFDAEYLHAKSALFRWKLGFLTEQEEVWITEQNVPRIPLSAIASRVWIPEGKSEPEIGHAREVAGLVASFFATLQETGADFTNAFRLLSSIPVDGSPVANIHEFISNCSPVEHLKAINRPQVPQARLMQLMGAARQLGPQLFHQAVGVPVEWVEHQLALHESFAERFSKISDESKAADDNKAWSEWIANYQETLKSWYGTSASESRLTLRTKVMDTSCNPKVTLRNWIAERVIEAEVGGRRGETQRVLDLLLDPFGGDELRGGSTVPHPKHDQETSRDENPANSHMHEPPPNFFAPLPGKAPCVS